MEGAINRGRLTVISPMRPSLPRISNVYGWSGCTYPTDINGDWASFGARNGELLTRVTTAMIMEAYTILRAAINKLFCTLAGGEAHDMQSREMDKDIERGVSRNWCYSQWVL